MNMQAFDPVIKTLDNIMKSFGPSIIVPIVIFVIAVALGVKVKRAFQAGLNAGIGLVGFSLLIGAYTPIVSPVIQRMVQETGIQLSVLDTGWQATSVVAYSTEAGMIFLGLGLFLQIMLFVCKYTNIFMPSDLWNNYTYMLWGSMLYVATGSMMLSILLMIVCLLYSIIFAEILAKRWATYYKYPGCTMTAPHHTTSVPLALLVDWILVKLGANKINWSPDSIKEKIGFIGDPLMLGLVLGCLIGFAGNFHHLDTLSAWGETIQVGVATATVMCIFPKIAGVFASAFTTITDASRKSVKKTTTGSEREWYLAINDAAGYGETATLLTGFLLIPLVFVSAIILPGNQTLPMVDLIAIPYMIEAIIAISNGNIFKSLISGFIWCIGGLYIITAVSPIFTDVVRSVNPSMLPAGVLLICSFAVMTNHIMGILFLVFLTQNPIWIGLSIVVYAVSHFFVRLNIKKIHNYMEKQALGDAYQAPELQQEELQ